MSLMRRGRWLIAILILVPVLAVAGFSVWAASISGDLPWQTDPTRIPVTPFADIPGFGTIATPVPTAAPALESRLYAV